MVKIYVLAENTAKSSLFGFEHGLSLYIETSRHRILFDCGQSDVFIKNAALLGLDLSSVDIAILSHGHYDHGGGLARFMEINKTALVYANKNAFGEFYHGTEKYIGLPKGIKQDSRMILTEDTFLIDDELMLCTCNDRPLVYPMESAGLTKKTPEGFLDDLFFHEQYLIINDRNRKIVVSGCSHKGVLNIVDWLKPDIFVGGFHFMKQRVEGGNRVLDDAAQILSGSKAIYYTNHCTGCEQYGYLKNRMGEQLHYISSGEVVEL